MAHTKTETRGRKKTRNNLDGRVELRIEKERKDSWLLKAKDDGKSLTAWLSSLADAA